MRTQSILAQDQGVERKPGGETGRTVEESSVGGRRMREEERKRLFPKLGKEDGVRKV